MPTLKDFVSALQAGWFPSLAAFVGCIIIVLGDYYRLPYLSSTPPWLLTTAVFVGVFSFSVLAANLAYLPVVVWRAVKKSKAKKRFKESVERAVWDAPFEEREILAYLVSSGRRAFNAEYNDRRLSPLVAKGMLKKLGGTHSVLEWPYIVQTDVWQLLLENKEHFHFPNAHERSDPFHWMA